MLGYGFTLRLGVDAGWREFVSLWIGCYVGLLLLYFAVGLVLQSWNRRQRRLTFPRRALRGKMRASPAGCGRRQ